MLYSMTYYGYNPAFEMKENKCQKEKNNPDPCGVLLFKFHKLKIVG